jgi:hypothetical protein
MAKQTINTGSALGDRTGDNGRVAFTKVNDNFDELYGGLSITAAETAASVTPTDYSYPPGDVRRYGAVDGEDSTAAIESAMSVSAQNKQDVIIPVGTWIISSELGFPNQYTIRGSGRGSRLLLDLSAGEWAFKYSAGSSLQSWGFEGLYFDVKPGSSQDVGAIAITNGSTLRSAFIRRLYSDNLHRLVQMDDVFGSLFLEDWSCKLSHLLSDGTTSAVEPTSGNIALDLAHGTANAVYARGIEILGFFRTGIKHTGRVFSLTDWNIAGSVTSSSELECAVHLLNSRNFSLINGYTEKMRAQSSSFEGWATGNGSATTVIIEHTDGSSSDLAGKIENLNCATGAVYILGATGIELENIAYAEANGGLRVGSGTGAAAADVVGGSAYARNSALKNQPLGTGDIFLVDGNNCGRGFDRNPTLHSWNTIDTFATLGGGASFADETTDYISGDRSIKVTTAAQFEGVTYSCVTPIADTPYTVCAKVKAQTADADVRMDVTSDTSHLTTGANRWKTSTDGEWQLLTIAVQSTTTTVSVRIRSGLNGAATFLIDAINVFPGLSSFDPSNCSETLANENYTLSNYDVDRTLDASTATTAEIADFVATLATDLIRQSRIR